MTDITTFKINGTTPFWSHGDSADERLSEAHAMLSLLAGAHNVCEGIDPDEREPFENTRHCITARALDGIATLVALAQHHTDMAHEQRRTKIQEGKWGELRDAYLTAAANEKCHTDKPSPEFGAPELADYEARTDALCDTRADAFNAMMCEPAPTRGALAFKLRAYHAMQAYDGWEDGGKIAAQLAEDAARLSA